MYTRVVGAAALVVFLVLVGMVYVMRRRAVQPLTVGDVAPDFMLQDETGTYQKLTDYRGRTVILYFYPKDDTPGCTAQACGLRDNYAPFSEHNIVIFGINYDSVESHKKFKEKYHLPFALLSDHRGRVAQKYGAAASLIQRIVPARMTFVINAHGVITHILPNVSVTTHAAELMKIVGLL